MAATALAEKVSVAISAALALCLIFLLLPIRSFEAPPPRPETQAEALEEPPTPSEETPPLTQVVLPPPPDLGGQAETPVPPAPRAVSQPAPPPEAPSEPPPPEIPAEPQFVLKPMKAAPRAAPPPKPLTPLAPPAQKPPPEIAQRPLEVLRQDDPPLPAEPERSAPMPPREASAPAEKITVSLEKEEVAQGRVLLRMLEHGAGPSIEIAWPDSERERDRLFERLRSCYGMRLAAMDSQDRLYVADGGRGVPWELNLDRYSGFIRQPAGLLAAAERRALADIQSYHARLQGAVLVRLFPRQVDALLLGGLQQIIGEGYRDSATIHARYRMEGSGILIERIEVDRRALPGRIDLSTGAARRCRRSA